MIDDQILNNVILNSSGLHVFSSLKKICFPLLHPRNFCIIGHLLVTLINFYILFLPKYLYIISKCSNFQIIKLSSINETFSSSNVIATYVKLCDLSK